MRNSRVYFTATILLGLLALVLSGPCAFAHSHPVAYSPEPNSVVASPPAVTIHFTATLEPKFSSIKVTDAKGKQVNAKQSRVDSSDAKVMTVALPALNPGSYTVHWVSVALDGHRLEGTYDFTVK